MWTTECLASLLLFLLVPFDGAPTTIESASRTEGHRKGTTRKIVPLHQQVHGHDSIVFVQLQYDPGYSRRQGTLQRRTR